MALPQKTKPQPATETPQNIPKIGSLFKWITCLQEMRYTGQIKQSVGIILSFTYTVSRTKQGETLTLAPYQLDEALRLGRLIKIQ
jgi:hypothetical protein